jgi:hypothetical protein
MDQCLPRVVSSQLHDSEDDKDSEVDTGEVVDESADEPDSEAVERVVDSQVEELTNEIDHVASEGGSVEFWTVDKDTDGHDDCLAATSSPPPTH